MKTIEQYADDFCHEIEGTCKSSDEVSEMLEIPADKGSGAEETSFWHRVDDKVFLCEGCNWWFAICEMSDCGDWICEDCEDD